MNPAIQNNNPVTRLEGTPVGALQHRRLRALVCLAFVSCPPVFIGVDGAIFNTSNPFDYPDDILQTLSNKQFRKGAHLICMQDRIDYGWEMALLLQRAKGEIEARRTALLPQDLRQLPQSPETGRTGLSFPGPDGLVDASQKMGCRYDTLFYCPLSFYP